MTRADLEDWDVVVENDLQCIRSEVYAKLTYSGSHVSFTAGGHAGEDGHPQRLSKSHAMTGWRVGYVLGDRHWWGP
jgi:aspartate/methionine/tyrosine aminotransferase